jgi:hypothetical protein
MTPLHLTVRIPTKNSAAYKAGEFLYQNGPKPEADVFQAVDFGTRARARLNRLQAAIIDGWLAITPNGLIVCSKAALDHFDDQPEPSSKYVGKVAAPRIIDVMNRPAWRSNLNPRGNRSDIPDWSHRTPGFKSFTQA